MAKAVAAVALLGLVAWASSAGARGPETDPARRSLVVEAVEKASPAVVNISTEEVVERRGSPFPFPNDPFFDEFFRDFFDARPRKFTRTSLGSGVVTDSDGTIVTNEHVVLRATKIHVTLADEREFEAKLVGADADSDLAVLRIKAKDKLPHIAVGTSSDIMIGETVIAIGNPFGLSHTVTTGVVSALGRTLRDEERVFHDFIQTDASINPGNSGGPLLNIKGELIGINPAIYGKAQGIGFAIPIDRVKRISKDLVSFGEVKRAWLGLRTQDLTPELATHFNVKRGVVVADLAPAGPATAAGVVRGDVIVKVDGHEVESNEDFEQWLQTHGEGESVKLSVLREGALAEIEVTSKSVPAEDADAIAWKVLGIAVELTDESLLVKKVRGGSPAAGIGMQRGDRLLGLNGAPTHSVSDFRRQMIELRAAQSALVSVGRGPYQYNVNVRLTRE